MAKSIHVVMTDSLSERLDAWRASQKVLTGKTIQRSSAICRLLDSALGEVEQIELPTFAELVKRVEALEEDGGL